jgi:hypothetical protein
MPRKTIELPPEVAKAFVKDMRARNGRSRNRLIPAMVGVEGLVKI